MKKVTINNWTVETGINNDSYCKFRIIITKDGKVTNTFGDNDYNSHIERFYDLVKFIGRINKNLTK